jgi:hypothetical protein
MPKLSLTLTEKEKGEWKAYATTKGFTTLSGLIRFATMQYMTKYPISPRRRTAERLVEEK